MPSEFIAADRDCNLVCRRIISVRGRLNSEPSPPIRNCHVITRQARRRIAPANRPPQPPLLRRGQAGNLRPRVRPAARRAASDRSRSTPSWSRPTAPRSASAASRSRASTPSRIASRCCRSTTPTTPTSCASSTARIRKLLGGEAVTYVVELKIDGVAISLTYENGLLTVGATRGDGEHGDDVTHNLRTINELPLRLHTDDPPPLFEARGEVYMTRAELARINRERAAEGEEPYANPRNLDRRHAQAARPEADAPSAGCGCSPTPSARPRA